MTIMHARRNRDAATRLSVREFAVHDHQPRPHPHHPCRQPAAQRKAVRPADAQEAGEAYDPKVLAAEMDKAVRHVVDGQMDAGIDVGNDGEQRRVGFQTYVPQRMTGFARRLEAPPRPASSRNSPNCSPYLMRRFPNPAKSQQGAPEAQAEIKYADLKPITARSRGFNKIADELGAFSERFMTAPSPGIISTTMLNAYYDIHDAYLDAIAREMSKEYQAIHKAGLILQIDAPDLAMDRTMMYRDLVRRAISSSAASATSPAINKGIEGIPRDRVRLHVCYGNWEGPHIHDIPLGEDPAGALHRQMSARCRSSSPIRATPTNTRCSRSIRCRRT